MEYRCFRTESRRERVVESALSLARYLKENKIPHLLLIDRAARPLYLGINRVWKHLFSSEQKPFVYFINPEGTNPLNRSQAEIDLDFTRNHPYLTRKVGEPLALFDVCVHSGVSMQNVSDALLRQGFSDIHLVATHIENKKLHSGLEVDLLPGITDRGCNPYNRDLMTYKTPQGVVSKVQTNSQFLELSRLLRREISEIFTNAGYD